MVDDLNQLVQLEVRAIGRRLRGMAMISRGIVPNLVISQRVVNKIASIANQFIEDETGESMVGLVLDAADEPEAMPTIYVLDTISPDEEETLRRTHTFQQGDDLQDEIIWWLQENWRLCREMKIQIDGETPLADHWDVPLRYVGDWHKQPGYMIQPSGGDLMTALSWMDDDENGMEYLLVPIVTLGHPATTLENDSEVNYFTVSMDDGTALRVDWWYIHRDIRFFQPITPKIIAEDTVPGTANYPWHLTRPDRMEEEVQEIQRSGRFVEALIWQADGSVPMELAFFVARPGSSIVLLLMTEHDFPRTPPRIRTAPFMRYDPGDDFYDIFEMFWQESEPIDDPEGWTWETDSWLIEYIEAVENSLGLEPLAPPEPVVQDVPVEADNTISGEDSLEQNIKVTVKETAPAKTPKKEGVVKINVEVDKPRAKAAPEAPVTDDAATQEDA